MASMHLQQIDGAWEHSSAEQSRGSREPHVDVLELFRSRIRHNRRKSVKISGKMFCGVAEVAYPTERSRTGDVLCAQIDEIRDYIGKLTSWTPLRLSPWTQVLRDDARRLMPRRERGFDCDLVRSDGTIR